MPEPGPFTLSDDGRLHTVTATVRPDGVTLDAAALTALGWTLEPRGLCQGARCIPLGTHAGAITPAGVDLATLATLLERPLALAPAERVAWLGAPAGARAAQLASLAAPDFELPDLAGHLHRLSDERGRKVLLLAYASW